MNVFALGVLDTAAGPIPAETRAQLWVWVAFGGGCGSSCRSRCLEGCRGKSLCCGQRSGAPSSLRGDTGLRCCPGAQGRCWHSEPALGQDLVPWCFCSRATPLRQIRCCQCHLILVSFCSSSARAALVAAAPGGTVPPWARLCQPGWHTGMWHRPALGLLVSPLTSPVREHLSQPGTGRYLLSVFCTLRSNPTNKSGKSVIAV